ncbi:hypothetical protein AWV80_16180 [Cupriavidus sp. UYMU48A]|nr:hypothetical protein AWV80_16180 [Cupriavidus sp. UYMU48A]
MLDMTVTKLQEVMDMSATRIEMCDQDGDGVLTIRDDGAEFSGVALELSNLFGEDVVADLDKHQLLNGARWSRPTFATKALCQPSALRKATSTKLVKAGRKSSLASRNFCSRRHLDSYERETL